MPVTREWSASRTRASAAAWKKGSPAFLSDNHLEPDLAIEVFVLDQPLD